MSKATTGGIVAGLLLLILGLSLGSVWLDSTTSDEVAHIAGGMVKVLHGQLEFHRFQPPFWDAVIVVPIILDGVRIPPLRSPETANAWSLGRHILYRTGHDAHRLLFLARLPTIAALLALCLAVYWFVARETGSRGWGMAGLVLSGFCPLIMAHGRLATVDVATTLFLFLGVTLLVRLIEQPSIAVAIALGLASSAAVMSKSSGLILGPVFLVLILLAFALRGVAEPRRFLSHFAVAGVAGLIFAEIVILGMASPRYIRANFPSLDSPMGRLAIPVAEGVENIRAIHRWYAGGLEFPQFLLGEHRYTGWLHYYPVAIFLKTTIPALIFVLIGIVAMTRRLPTRMESDGAASAPARFAAAACFIFVGAYLIAAMRSEITVGVRHVLPIYPLAYAGAIIAVAQAWGEVAAARRRAFGVMFGALMAWHGVENLVAYPGYIAYFNEFAGGKANADRLLIDSNLDWGQDLRRLAIWARQNGVGEITVHYFGGADIPTDMKGIRTNIWYSPGPEPLPRGWFALSRHFYRSSESGMWPVDYETYLQANGARYVTTVGDSILVYRVP